MANRWKRAEMSGPGTTVPVDAAATGRTTTQHRPLCTRPGWEVEHSGSLRGVDIARCVSCGAVELRTEAGR